MDSSTKHFLKICVIVILAWLLKDVFYSIFAIALLVVLGVLVCMRRG